MVLLLGLSAVRAILVAGSGARQLRVAPGQERGASQIHFRGAESRRWVMKPGQQRCDLAPSELLKSSV